MVQTCWLPDQKERPSFTKLKQLTWESISNCSRENDSNMNVCPSLLSDNNKQYKRYRKMRKCSYGYQRQKKSGTKDETSSSIATQCYADLDLTRLKEASKKDSLLIKSAVEYFEKEEEIPLKEVPDKLETMDDLTSNGKIKLVGDISVIFSSNQLQ